MKKALAIIVISIFLVSMCVLEEILVKTTLDKISTDANEIYTQSQTSDNLNSDIILKKCETLQNFWEEKEDMLCFFVNHKDMQDMGNQLVNLIAYAKNNSKEDFTSSISLIIYYTTSYHHLMGVSLQNIF